jgi:hypothetical protein
VNVGPKLWHGPHHRAQKPTSTRGVGATVASQVISVRSVVYLQKNYTLRGILHTVGGMCETGARTHYTPQLVSAWWAASCGGHDDFDPVLPQLPVPWFVPCR